MASHTTTVVVMDNGRYMASCACRWRGNHSAVSHQAAEDEIAVHLAQVERARASARRGVPSLQSQRDYYRMMAEGEDQFSQDGHLWRQLADEIDRRLNEEGADDGTQSTLF